MLKIQKSAVGKCAVFGLSGRIEAQHLPDLQALFTAEDQSIVLDLKEVNLVDREGVRFLVRCEAGGVRIDNCPAYVRERMVREKTTD
jgi:anti-anti-sigma regulatory factor